MNETQQKTPQTLYLGLKRIEIYKYKTYTLLILLLIKFLSSYILQTGRERPI